MNRQFSASSMRNSRPTAANARAYSRQNAAVHRDRNFSNAAVRNNRMHAATSVDARRQMAATRNLDRADRRAAARNAASANVQQQAALNRATTFDRASTNRAAAFRAYNPNARVVNNWRSEQFTGNNYRAFRDYRRQWHNRDWWRHNYSRISLVGGGWWYWDGGYWYPAWGYDPSYSYYPYDGPIYGYADLTPDQVIVNVQAQLQNDGYYSGAVDGILGPQTRRAIAAFQADHGLAVTSAVDQPTLATLGLS